MCTIKMFDPLQKNQIVFIALSNLGLLLQAFAESWDVTSYLLKAPESFFTPPYIVLYIGIGLLLIAFL